MRPRFHALSAVEFAELVARFPFTRRITGIHVHHTVNVPASAFRGLETLEAMRRAHVERERWTDLAQHATVAPDGTIWTGRQWNLPPCSIAGHNGDRASGPFMTAIAGDFDDDRLIGAQRLATVDAIASVQERFDLPASAIRFHRDLSRTACPGLHVDKRDLIEQVAQRRLERRRAADGVPPGARTRPFRESARAYAAALGHMQSQPLPDEDESPLAEPAHVRERVAPAVVNPVGTAVLSAREGPGPAVPSARHLALCVGIDTYPDAPLAGCAADARLWEATLRALGFTVDVLIDGAATRRAILGRLDGLVSQAGAGDVLVFQYAGHGTQVPDASSDEPDRMDEALCPVDFQEGHLLIDDDVAPIMNRIAGGASLTCFVDCCHSGTVTRLGVTGGRAAQDGGTPGEPADERPRFMVATPALVEAHRRFRVRLAGAGPPRAGRREVLFAACRPGELAWETNGQGDFTRKATRRLAEAARIATNGEFQEQVLAAFGPAPRQHPQLTCTAAARRRLLLAPADITADA